ncbi:MAG: PilL N-terminal domain-containing protein [Candidatus Accumulibacter sp.]|jgi:type IV pili sensor histidine kinase/response regulator|nr:PilL N-terminal domain-containing protein [Accumulibacter sp.]
MPVIDPLHRLTPRRLLSVLTTTTIFAGCVVPPETPPPDTCDAVREETAFPAPDILPMTRQGRYTLVELAPEAAQRDLMRQLVEISIPPTLEAQVGETLRHVLRQSGYQLCPTTDAALDALPLPAAHRRLGPMTLRDALLTLTGPAWKLSVDDFSRQVCFTRRAPERTPELSEIPPDANTTDWRTQP